MGTEPAAIEICLGAYLQKNNGAWFRYLATCLLRLSQRLTPFPDWLGYMGLALLYTEDDEREHGELTKAWYLSWFR